MNGTHTQRDANPDSKSDETSVKNYKNRMHNLKEAI